MSVVAEIATRKLEVGMSCYLKGYPNVELKLLTLGTVTARVKSLAENFISRDDVLLMTSSYMVVFVQHLMSFPNTNRASTIFLRR
jgi:hypothetical protein